MLENRRDEVHTFERAAGDSREWYAIPDLRSDDTIQSPKLAHAILRRACLLKLLTCGRSQNPHQVTRGHGRGSQRFVLPFGKEIRMS